MKSKIKSLRERLGMTQKQIAEHLDVNVGTYAGWERDQKPPAWVPKYLQMLANQEGVGSPLVGTNATIKDPLHRKILERLNERIDPVTFELCTVDLLLNADVPVVLIGGVSDGGIDGAISRKHSVPAPLIITTATDVLRNFKRNLTTAKDHTESRIVFVATCKRIRPDTRCQIEEFAKDNGFDVGQIFDQYWFALQLYRNPVWRNRLLGVSGRPSALCTFPETKKPVLGTVVIGRETEIQILVESENDVLLTGAPGAGKTFLFCKLTQERGAFFLCDHDPEAIADAIREQEPRIVFVDDAHSEHNKLKCLISIRKLIGARFRIIASSWPNDQYVNRICELLDLKPSDLVNLPPLSDEQIIEIIETTGVRGPVHIQAMIRQQAQGMPGLAVTLSSLCLSSDVDINRIASGDVLLSKLIPQLVENIDEDIEELLAPFAIGGSAGMSRKVVAAHLGKSDAEILKDLTNLSEAGIIKPRFDDHMVVLPLALAMALVRKKFFGSIPHYDGCLQLFNESQYKSQALTVLIGVHAFGARIPYIHELVKEHGSTEHLKYYARIRNRRSIFRHSRVSR